ncbi:MAG: tetraacyldisaccharide 4'-kinase [Lysobacterales bacterium]
MPISPERLQAIWYQGAPIPWYLKLGSVVYGGLRLLVQLPWRLRLRRPRRLEVPVIVVGNLTVGGTGKTPLTIALVEALRAQGYGVGVISRGYGRRTTGVRLVDRASTAAEVGDEPLLIARLSRAPVAVGEDRVAAAQRLIGVVPLDVLISDDGLEHLALPRCCEIVVIDGQRGFGNGRLLPAGPLRAPLSRLRKTQLRVRNGGEPQAGELAMTLKVRALRKLGSERPESLQEWRGRKAHVIAGTGNPARVFATVRSLGIEVIEHTLADHHDYARSGMPEFDDGLPCITTEKDAVKLASDVDWYVLEVRAEIDPAVVAAAISAIEAASGR